MNQVARFITKYTLSAATPPKWVPLMNLSVRTISMDSRVLPLVNTARYMHRIEPPEEP